MGPLGQLQRGLELSCQDAAGVSLWFAGCTVAASGVTSGAAGEASKRASYIVFIIFQSINHYLPANIEKERALRLPGKAGTGGEHPAGGGGPGPGLLRRNVLVTREEMEV